jgi:hypothetical protein
VFAACGDKDETVDNGSHVRSETIYYLDTVSLWTMGSGFESYFDKDKSYVKLSPDGNIDIQLRVSDVALSMAKIALLAIDASTVDVMGFECYVEGLFPGESLGDLESIVDRLKTAFGVEITGIDFSNENIQAICTSLKENGTLPEHVKLPVDEICISIKNHYCLKDVKSDTRDEPFKAVYVGDYTEHSDPYVILTQGKSVDGADNIILRNEVLRLTAEFKIPQAVIEGE